MFEANPQVRERQATPSEMLESLLQAQPAPPSNTLPDVPQTLEEAERQLDELITRRAEAMNALAKL